MFSTERGVPTGHPSARARMPQQQGSAVAVVGGVVAVGDVGGGGGAPSGLTSVATEAAAEAQVAVVMVEVYRRC